MSASKPCLLLLPLLFISPAYGGPGTSNPYGGKRALVIGIDGLRSDALKQQVETGNAPHIASLVNAGTVTWNAYAGGQLGTATEQPTISGPGWTSILTGMWTDRHNVVGNGTPAYNQPGVSGSYLVTQAPHFAKRLEEAAPGTFASSIVSWNWIEDYLVAAQPTYLDHHAKGSGSSYPVRDLDVKSKAVAHLSSADPDVLFLHFDQVDGAGHSYGFSTTVPQYMSAIAAVDGLIGEVMSAVNARPSRASEQWMVVLTTDHGGTSGGGHGGQSAGERTIPFLVSGNGIPTGVSNASPGQAAVPATVMRYFGIGIPATWNLAEDGFVTGATFQGAINGSAVELSWTMPLAGVPGLTGFEILRNRTSIATLPSSQTTFTDPSPLPGSNNYELLLAGTNEATLKQSLVLPNPGERIWDDANSNNAWNTTDANWQAGTTFANGNDAIFNGSAGEPVTIDAGGVSPALTKVNSGSYTFAGGSIGGVLEKNGGGSLTLSSANAFTSSSVKGGPNSQDAGALQIGNFSALGSGPLSFGHVAGITGIYFLPSAGSGTLPNDISLPSPTNAITTRLLTDQTNLTVTLGGILSGGSATHELLIDNDSSSNDVGKIRLSNSANTFTSSRVRINRGGLVVTSDAALGNLANDLNLDVTSDLANSGLVLEGSVNLGADRSVTISSQTVIDTQDTPDAVSGPLTLTGQMVKRGSAELRLNGAGSGNGGASLAEGSITLGNAAGLGTGTLGVTSTAAAGFLNTTPITGPATIGNAITLPNDTTATNRTILMSGGSGNTLTLGGTISGGSANTTLYLNTSLSGDNAATFLLTGANTFTGKTQLNRGSLSINSNASLGAATNPLVIDANVGSKLLFTAAMDFTHPVTLGTSTVFESNAPVSIPAVISGGAALTTSGSSAITLSGSNTHTGTIQANGILNIDGSIAASSNAVTVASAAKLGGSGTISRPVSVSGTLAPGNGVGTLTIPSTLTFQGGSSYAFDIGAWTGAAGTGYDTLAVSNLSITSSPASKFTVNIDASGMSGFANTARSFVISSATSPVSGLTSGNWSITTAGFSFPGVWSLSTSGNELRLNYSPSSGFSAWISGKNLPEDAAAFEDDADQDGIANGLEFVLGTEPGIPSAEGLPKLHANGSDFIFSFECAAEADYLQPIVEYSQHLDDDWTEARDGEDGVMATTVESAEARTVIVTIPGNGMGKIFARLRVSEPR